MTLILERIRQGDSRAEAELMPLVYDELRALAAARMRRESADRTLQATALVHEAWLRLGGDAQPGWQNRRHFFGAAAEAMRRILIERARRRRTACRGGDPARVDLESLDLAAAPADDRLLAVNEAVDRLAALDPAKAEFVKLRFYAGLGLEEAAATLDISPATAKRWWVFARAWLLREIERADAGR